MVEVLAAPGVVGADGLQVAVGARADPHVGPGRRDRQRLEPGHVVGAERCAELVEVDETVAAAPP